MIECSPDPVKFDFTAGAEKVGLCTLYSFIGGEINDKEASVPERSSRINLHFQFYSDIWVAAINGLVLPCYNHC